jgi:hypothetical protein
MSRSACQIGPSVWPSLSSDGAAACATVRFNLDSELPEPEALTQEQVSDTDSEDESRRPGGPYGSAACDCSAAEGCCHPACRRHGVLTGVAGSAEAAVKAFLTARVLHNDAQVFVVRDDVAAERTQGNDMPHIGGG